MKKHKNRTYFYVHLNALPKIKTNIRFHFDKDLELFYTYDKVPDQYKTFVISKI